jgi:hypothetical protein
MSGPDTADNQIPVTKLISRSLFYHCPFCAGFLPHRFPWSMELSPSYSAYQAAAERSRRFCSTFEISEPSDRCRFVRQSSAVVDRVGCCRFLLPLWSLTACVEWNETRRSHAAWYSRPIVIGHLNLRLPSNHVPLVRHPRSNPNPNTSDSTYRQVVGLFQCNNKV